MSEEKNVYAMSRSAIITELAESAKSSDEVVEALKSMLANDIRKAVKYAETNFQIKAFKYLETAYNTIGFKPSKTITTVDAKTKYTKKLELKFSSKINPDFKAFVLKGLDESGVLINQKSDTVVYAFKPEKFDRIVARTRPLQDIITTIL